MDWGYIFFNTLIYGLLAISFAGFFAYSKFLNLSVGAYFVAIAYLLADVFSGDFGRQTILFAVVILGSYFLLTKVLWKFFPNDTQRDHVGLIITLARAMILENLINYIYGPSSVSLDLMTVPARLPIIAVIVLFVGFYYIFSKTAFGSIFRGLFEKSTVIRSLGVRSLGLLQTYYAILGVLLLGAAFLLLNESAVRSSDGVFYLIKGIGIMILVGINKKEYMFLGALIYVLLEYFLFITLDLPLSYKEALVLVVILLVLVIKPEGLFSFGKRKI